MHHIKPQKLQPGQTLGIVSPSWGGPAAFPHIYEEGVRVLTEELGFKVREFDHTRADAGFLYRHPQLRAADINRAFLDKEISGIIASIGGDDAVRILPYLDRQAVIANPKFFMGYSDTTTLTTYFNRLGLVTFNGPSVMAGFAQWNSFEDDFKAHLRQFLTGETAHYTYPEFKRWADGYLDWNDPANTGKVEALQASDGWRWLQGSSGVATGKLFGGCIEVLEFMKGTEFWAPRDFWNDKILFFETSEEKPTVDNVKRMLRNYGSQGILEKASGVLFGRAKSYSVDEKRQLDEAIIGVVKDEFGRSDMPVISNMDFVHTDPQIILPLGVKAEINCREKTLTLLESALS